MAKASRVQSRMQQQLNDIQQKLDFIITHMPLPGTGDNPYLSPEEAEKLEATMKPNSFEGVKTDEPPGDETPATPASVKDDPVEPEDGGAEVVTDDDGYVIFTDEPDAEKSTARRKNK